MSKYRICWKCTTPATCRSLGNCGRDGEPLLAPGVPEPLLPAQSPIDGSAARKAAPVWSGVLNYFPDALMAVARLSKAGNDKHNPGEPLHWSRDKSNDHMDCAARHMLTPFEIDEQSGEVHLVCAVWRALAELQLFEEKRLGKEPPKNVR